MSETAAERCLRCRREAHSDVVNGLFGVLFPTHFGLPDLTNEGIDYFVGHRLDATLWSLLEQVKRELKLPRARLEPDGLPEVIGGRAR